MTTPGERLSMAESILKFEGQFDKQGRLKIYWLPPGDGGGTYEVAGINERYNPVDARRLADLIQAGQPGEAEAEAIKIIACLTDPAATWTGVVALEAYLRDCMFNRGLLGAARILQRALAVVDDGHVGEVTRVALRKREADPPSLLDGLRSAREQYERDVAHRDEASIFWKGLVNRWNNALTFARTFLPEAASPPASSVKSTISFGTGNFYTDLIKKDQRYTTTEPVADIAMLEPKTRAAVLAIIEDAKAHGIQLVVFETYRSQERQAMLFSQGATKLQKVGVHHYGLACDLVKSVDGHPSWKGDFGFLGDLARHHRLIWGGDWGHPGHHPNFYDGDHVQRCAVGDQAALFSGRWYPGDDYDPYATGSV